MGAKRVIAGIGGLATVVALVVVYRANERRFHTLEQQLRAVTEEARQAPPPPPIVVWPAPTPTPSSTATPESEPAAARRSENEAEAPAITDVDQAAYVGTIFSQEAMDASWAKQMESSIGASLRNIVGTSSLDRLECRRTLCRASLRHQDQTKFSAFIDRVVGHANEWTGAVYSHRDAVDSDGAIQNTIYFSKPGEEIPLLN